MTHDLTAAYARWKANIVREPTDAEALEFDRRFASADPAVLDEALSRYFDQRGSRPRGPATVGELAAIYAGMETDRRGPPKSKHCRMCRGKGVLPEVPGLLMLQADAEAGAMLRHEPILRYGLPCTDCTTGADWAAQTKQVRGSRTLLPDWDGFTMAHDANPKVRTYADHIHDEHERLWALWRGPVVSDAPAEASGGGEWDGELMKVGNRGAP